MNRQTFLQELHSMLTFMTVSDRDAAIANYEAMLTAAEDEQELLASLGSPLRVAVQLSRGYERPEDELDVPALPSLDQPAQVRVSASMTAEPNRGLTRRRRASRPPKPVDPDAGKLFRLRPGVFAVYLLGSIVIALPVALLLAAVFLSVAAGGVGLVAAGVAAIKISFWGFAIIADLMLLWGAALLLFAVGLLLFWLGIWLLIAGAGGWVALVIRKGRKVCRREVVSYE